MVTKQVTGAVGASLNIRIEARLMCGTLIHRTEWEHRGRKKKASETYDATEIDLTGAVWIHEGKVVEGISQVNIVPAEWEEEGK